MAERGREGRKREKKERETGRMRVNEMKIKGRRKRDMDGGN